MEWSWIDSSMGRGAELQRLERRVGLAVLFGVKK